MERSIDTVARFFLSDCDTRDTAFKEDEGDTIRDTRPEVCFVLCPDVFTPQASFLGHLLAQSLAASNISVGLIETTRRLPHTFFLAGGYDNLDAVFWEADLDASDFSNVLTRFREANDIVLINVAASVLLKCGNPERFAGRYIVPTTVQPQDLLSAYGTMKNVSKRCDVTEIEFIVINQRPEDNAAGAAAVLEKMAHRFLTCSLRFIGAVTIPRDMEANVTVSSTQSSRPRTDVDVKTVKEITRQLMVTSGLRKKRKQNAEKRS